MLKGIKNGVEIILDDAASMTQILEEGKEKLSESQDFFGSSALHLFVSGKILAEDEQEELAKMIHTILPSRTNVTFYKEETTPIQVKAINYETKASAMFVKGTVRSGQVIEAPGDLIIAGDVNPGANVIAGENIVVMGNLRGIVHAGVNGNRGAVVIALKISPSQLRIADMITRAPDKEEKRKNVKPEIAYIKDDTIFIDDYMPRNM
jgi:septum site-determining protein MinC